MLVEHHGRADGLLIELDLLLKAAGGSFLGGHKAEPWIRALSTDQAVSLAVIGGEDLATRDTSFTTAAWCVGAFRKTPPPLKADDVRLLLSFDAKPNRAHYARPALISLALIALERLLVLGDSVALTVADEAADQLSAWNPDPGNKVWGLRAEALLLAGRPAVVDPTESGPFLMRDAFGIAAVDLLGASVEVWPAGLRELLEHCAAATGARPSAKWIRACEQRSGAARGAADIVERLLGILVETEPVGFMTDHGSHRRLLSGCNDDLARGLVWTAGVLDCPWLVPVLEAVAARCIRGSFGRTLRPTEVAGEKVQYACFHVLATSGTIEAVAQVRPRTARP